MPNYYIFTLRNQKTHPAYSCVVEFEDVLSNCLSAKCIDISEANSLTLDAYSKYNYLFIAGITIGDIAKTISLAGSLIGKFDGVFGYVFDSILPESEKSKANWKKQFSSFFKNVKRITKLYVPFRQSITEFQDCYGIPVGYMPLGVDALQFGGFDKNKWIDVNGYGRQDTFCSNALSLNFNSPNSSYNFHHTDHFNITSLNDFYAHRRYFWKFLRASKIALAFDAMYANNNNRFTFSFVGQRWFESTAAGCVVVGKRPTCKEMDELFPYADSTIEIPDNKTLFIPFIEALLNDRKRISSIGESNAIFTQKNHDWRVRIHQMIMELQLEQPDALKYELSKVL